MSHAPSTPTSPSETARFAAGKPRRRGIETGTQLESITSCVPVSTWLPSEGFGQSLKFFEAVMVCGQTSIKLLV